MSIFCRQVIVIVFSLLAFNVMASSAYEREQLRLILIQLDNAEVLAKQSNANKSTSVNDRFSFDYQQFNKDIQAIRQGILHYLDPSRAQPRELYELSTDYRADSKE